MTNEKVQFVSIEKFKSLMGVTALAPVKMPKSGVQMLCSIDTSTNRVLDVVGTLQKTLVGATPQETLNNIKAANCTIRLPEMVDGAIKKGENGLPELPCVVASTFEPLAKQTEGLL